MPIVPIALARPNMVGHEYSHTSLEILLNGVALLGVKSISYSTKKEVGKVYGTAPQRIGRTRGKEDPSCELEIYRIEWEIAKATLGAAGIGFGDTPSLLQVTGFEPGQPVWVDQIISAEITEAAFSSSDGTDPLTVKLTFDVMQIIVNGGLLSIPNKFGV